LASSPAPSGILPFLDSILKDITHNPVTDFRFLIPVVSILIFSVVLKHMSKVQKVDREPELERKQEAFLLPSDIFHVEVENIMKGNSERYVRMMQEEFDRLKMAGLNFKRLKRRYRRCLSMSRSGFKRRRARGELRLKEVLDRMMDLYSDVNRAKSSVLFVDTEES